MLISWIKFRISHQRIHFSLVQSPISFKQSFIYQIRQTIASHKTSVARDIACPRTKASTFAIEKIAKELAFPPPHLTAFVQLDSFFLPPPQKKLKPLVSILRTRRKIMTFRVFVQTKMNIFDMLTRQD